MVTATPFRLNGEGFTKIVEGQETKLVLNKSMFELQRESYLVPFRFFVCSIPDMANVRMKGNDYDDEESEKAMNLAPIVESYLEHANGLSCVVYAVTTRHSKKIMQQYLDAGITAEHVDANTEPEERAAIFARFTRKETMVLCNVGIATEGNDIPGIEAIQLARPTKSLSLIIQMIGRASRVLKGVLDGLNTAEERNYAIANSAKKNAIILDNCGALIEHPEVIEGHVEWETYFQGKKRSAKRVDEEIEILVYVAEDDEGKVTRTRNPKEVEGMRLIEITRETKQKIVNLKSLKEFDKYYAFAKNLKNVKKKGWFAIDQYLKYCNKNSFKINDDCWQYIEKILVLNIQERAEYLEKKYTADSPMGLFDPEYNIAIATLKARGLSEKQFKMIKREYQQANP